jgi:Glycosyltransferase family 87
MSTTTHPLVAERSERGRVRRRFGSIGPEGGDALLYGVSALFALITILTSGLALYRQWAELAIGPFLFGTVSSAVVAAVAARRSRRHREPTGTTTTAPIAPPTPLTTTPPTITPKTQTSPRLATGGWGARIVIATVVFAGATAIPLGLEILWRSNGDPGHAQPEVTVIERGGQTVAKGKDPYHEVTNPDGKVVYHARGESTVDAFLPYLPLMTVFGLPSTKKHDVGLTDARIFFSLVTLLVAGVALWLCRADGGRKMRALQVIAIFPTAALPLATGGDDMPIVAFLLLAMVLARRRQPFASGVVLGIVSAMKFTAWPLAALALFAAHNKKGARRPLVMFLGMLVVAGPVVVPFALRGPWAFFDNVVLFPLGLSGVNSPAASPLPGHLIVTAFPFLHRVLPVAVGSVGAIALLAYLWRRPPQTASQVCNVAGVVMAVITLFAPATRIGYLLYPINFFVWGHLFSYPDEVEELPPLRSAPEPTLQLG